MRNPVLLCGVASTAIIAIASPAPARADIGASLDFGYVVSRVAVTDQTALNAQLVRFAIRASTGRHFHFGAEAEEGSLSGTTQLPNGAVARSISPVPEESPLGGNTLGLKAFAGVHADAHRLIRLGADLALGRRDTWVESDAGPDVAGRSYEPLLEIRSRADVYLTKTATIGMSAASDLNERRNVSLAFLFALNFDR